MSLERLYASHLSTLDAALADAIERAVRAGVEIDSVLFHSGSTKHYHRDDQPIPFRPDPHFARWVPLSGPDHCVLARPGERPLVVRVAPRDYWYETTPLREEPWQGEVDLRQVGTLDEVSEMTGDLSRAAYVGGSPDAARRLGIPGEAVEPAPLMFPLDWHRAQKSGYEIAMITEACKLAAAGHRAAREAFVAGASELEIYLAYLAGTGHLEQELPFEAICAVDEKGAVLHYQNKRGKVSAGGSVLLMDAGAAHAGYASDVTRTWCRDAAGGEHLSDFKAIVDAVDELQRELVALVTPGRPYVEIHDAALRGVARILAESGLATCSWEAAHEAGLAQTFLPHGVGHHLGLQVHDVGGQQADPDGGRVAPPDSYPALRTTRPMAAGHVVTIEPGLYFIGMLLERLRDGEHASLVDWGAVDRLRRFGGVRIEDDVVCTEDAPQDLTRPLIAGPRGS